MFEIFKKIHQQGKQFINRAGKKMVEMTAETVLAADTKSWLENTITQWIGSIEREKQLDAERYYIGDQDINYRERKIVGSGGRLETVHNVINNKILNNIYGYMVDQKVNFSLGKPFIIESENDTAVKTLQTVFNDEFMQIINETGKQVLNGGRAAIYPYYNEDGEFCFEVFKASELLPIWKDSRHTKLLFCVRYYVTEKQKTFGTETVEKVQIFTKDACYNFIRSGGRLIPDTDTGDVTYYMTVDRVVDAAENKVEKLVYGWDRVPIIFFRGNSEELPLLNRCRSLQDAYNEIWSNFKNQMDEDPGQSIIVLHNYDGEDLKEFRSRLAVHRAIKVRSVDGVDGKVETLQIEVNAANYELILKLLKKSIIEQCRGFDVKDDTIGGNANKMHISAMYNDCELDANKLELEFKASLQRLLFFVTAHLANTGKGDFSNEIIKFRFDRDLIMDWQGDMATLVSMANVYPKEYIYRQTPGVDDPQELVKMEDAERKKAMEEFAMPMPSSGEHNANGGNDDE